MFVTYIIFKVLFHDFIFLVFKNVLIETKKPFFYKKKMRKNQKLLLKLIHS